MWINPYLHLRFHYCEHTMRDSEELEAVRFRWVIYVGHPGLWRWYYHNAPLCNVMLCNATLSQLNRRFETTTWKPNRQGKTFKISAILWNIPINQNSWPIYLSFWKMGSFVLTARAIKNNFATYLKFQTLCCTIRNWSYSFKTANWCQESIPV